MLQMGNMNIINVPFLKVLRIVLEAIRVYCTVIAVCQDSKVLRFL